MSTRAPSRGGFKIDRDVEEWHGAYVPYDIVKEFTAAFLAVLVITLGLAAIFSSPDDAPVTLRSWSVAQPVDFATTALNELSLTSPTATYGPPYTNTPDAAQKIGPIAPASIFGAVHPVNTEMADVIDPLRSLPASPLLDAAIDRYLTAPAARATAWNNAYATALAKASYVGGQLVVAPGNYGPVRLVIDALLAMARSGALDEALTSSHQFYGTDYTVPLLFIADGNYLADLAGAQHLQGAQWGMMNETGGYPGQAWLWLYTMWYQVPPFSSSTNADLLVWALMMVLTLFLIFLPFVPGLRSIPRYVPIYRLIWRRHYRALAAGIEQATPEDRAGP